MVRNRKGAWWRTVCPLPVEGVVVRFLADRAIKRERRGYLTDFMCCPRLDDLARQVERMAERKNEPLSIRLLDAISNLGHKSPIVRGQHNLASDFEGTEG